MVYLTLLTSKLFMILALLTLNSEWKKKHEYEKSLNQTSFDYYSSKSW